ncbi:MAG: WYL domain-containing protein [Rubrivivax sp.]|nr:WYL domain-containing protein [Rubrivivax sp.]
MDRTERFYRIEMLIRGRGSVPFDDLQRELEVSRATLHRDLQYLRERMDAPIVFDRDTEGYRLQAAAGGSANASHQLPGVWFSESEIHALLTLHQLIQGLDEGGVLARHLQPLLDKLHGMLGADEAEATEMRRRVRIAGTARRPVESQWFERVGDALRRRRQLQVHYLSRRRGERSERTLSPQRLVHYRHTWYLDAWCHGSRALRRFALDAIEQARVLDVAARMLPVDEVAAALDRGYGIFGGGRMQWATLRFEAEAAAWVAREEWHPQQQGRQLDDGRYELRLPFVDPTELAMDVLRHGEQVQVLAPPALREAVRRHLKAALVAYEGLPSS